MLWCRGYVQAYAISAATGTSRGLRRWTSVEWLYSCTDYQSTLINSTWLTCAGLQSRHMPQQQSWSTPFLGTINQLFHWSLRNHTLLNHFTQESAKDLILSVQHGAPGCCSIRSTPRNALSLQKALLPPMKPLLLGLGQFIAMNARSQYEAQLSSNDTYLECMMQSVL